jgi:large conductance mechanosensitive channel
MERFRDFGERGLHSGLSTLSGFEKFILRGNVVDLAVGIMIGAAFNGVVTSLVGDIITPLIPAAGKGLDGLVYRVPWTGDQLRLGPFIDAIITFLILAFVIYFFVVRPVNALTDRFKPHQEPQAPTTRECPFCMSSIPLKATRCPYCTSQLLPADTSTTQPRAQSA